MRLLKTHSHTSERPGYEARKNAKKVIEGNADTIRRQTIRQNLPRTASVAGGETKKALWQDQPPSKPSRVSSAWRGGRDEERRIEGQHRREDKENQSQNPPAGYHRGGGGETRGENQHKMERWHNPQSREGGRCLAENAYQKRKQNNVHHKGKKTKHTVLCYCVSSQLTLAAPRLGAEEGVGRTTKKKRTRKTYSPVPLFSGPITQTMAPY